MIIIDDSWIDSVRSQLPMLPDEIRKTYEYFGVNDVAISALILYKDLNKFLEQLIDLGADPIISANILTGDVLGYLNKKNININSTKLTPLLLMGLIEKLKKNEISSKIGKIILNDMIESGKDIDLIIIEKGLSQINDEEELLSIIRSIINDNISLKEEYKNNSDRTIKYVMGFVMKSTDGKANPELAIKLLKEELTK
jgi:aspartyl-tRNA(Asn)/glutamyl-tRNA(Gln) amidotransferase subunit B